MGFGSAIMLDPIFSCLCGISYSSGGQWLGNEEKRVLELIQRPRSRSEDHQPWGWETITEKEIDATMVEQLLKEMENLKIAMVKKSEDRPTSSKYMNHRCIWCDNTEHDRKDCDEHKEALRQDWEIGFI